MADRPVLSLEAFTAAVRASRSERASTEPGETAAVRASFDTEIKAAADGARTMTFTISTASVDRMGDTIAVAGWELAKFRKNPVVLWAHDQSRLPLARATRVAVEGGRLVAAAEFTPAGVEPFNDTVFAMLEAGFLNATSVGFLPLEWAFTDRGVDYKRQELLEFSVVPVPANAEALVQARAIGIDLAPLAGWIEAAAQAQDLALIPRARLAAVAALPKKFRGIAKAMPDSAKAARGQFRRVANDIEEALGIAAAAPDQAPAAPAPAPAPAPAASADPPRTPRLVMARRRLDQVRRTLG